jgi:hypothetical protein
MVDTERPEDPPHALTVGHGHHRRPGRRSAVVVPDRPGGGGVTDPPLLFDLLVQVGDPDVPGPAGVEGRFDGGADVVGMDVAVPQTLAADHHDRIADPGPDLLEGGHGGVGRVEEVHHLVAQVPPLTFDTLRPAGSRGVGLGQDEDGGAVGIGVRRLGQRPAVHRGQKGVQHEQIARPPGVDHPRLGQHR